MTVYFRGAAEGTFQLLATAPQLEVATQAAAVGAPPDALVFTTAAPPQTRAGSCLVMSVQAQRGGAAAVLPVNTPVTLSVAPTGGARFYGDAACSTPAADATIAAGTASATFFVKPLTAGTNTVTAAASFGMASQAVDTRAMVRRGSCGFSGPSPLADGGTSYDTSETCSFSPAVQDLGAALLFAQVTATANHPGALEARCRLSSATQVQCGRRNGDSFAPIHFQVAEVPRGLTVQRFSSSTCPATLALAAPVDPAKSFVVKAVANDGSLFDDEDTTAAVLDADGGQVSIQGMDCGGLDVQVAEWDGVTVTRALLDGGLPVGVTAAAFGGLPPASQATVALLQPNTASTADAPVCELLVRASVASPSEVQVSRGAGNADGGCAGRAVEQVWLERVDFGSRAQVQQKTVTLAVGDTTAAVAITPVDASRAVVFASTQLGGGQAAGETDLVTPSRVHEASARCELTAADTVRVTRARALSTAVFTFYVVELDP